jgi:hypothetical protein
MPMTDEERRAWLEREYQETVASMTPFETYLYEIGQFDDRAYPETPTNFVVVEPHDGCSEFGCDECIGYWERDGEFSFCSHSCHKERPNIPFDHCSYLGQDECPGNVTQGRIVSPCTCPHHQAAK